MQKNFNFFDTATFRVFVLECIILLFYLWIGLQKLTIELYIVCAKKQHSNKNSTWKLVRTFELHIAISHDIIQWI